MIDLSKRISRILPSATLEMTAKAAELKRQKKLRERIQRKVLL